jgi:hypothetical protein
MNQKLFDQNKRLKKQLDILRKQGVPIPVVPTKVAKAKPKTQKLPYTKLSGEKAVTEVKKNK